MTFTRPIGRGLRLRLALACLATLWLVAARSTGADNSKLPLPAHDQASPSAADHETQMPARPDAADVPDPAAAEFDQWQPLVDPNRSIYDDPAEPRPCDDEPADGLRPFDYLRHAGFHHSSTEGRFLSKNIAMTTSSWLNRPYHVDWFAGPLISDDPVEGRVSQSNEILVGLRLGWDFDYYWGLQWRFGWADADIVESGGATPTSGTYFVGDVDLLYYPWGDTKVRPYFQLGLGGSQIGSIRSDGSGQEAWLLGMPFGLGVEFPQTRWLAWRLEVIDNLAFGSDGLDTMHNVSFTAGMEYRFGARPGSYWPWRSSRTSW